MGGIVGKGEAGRERNTHYRRRGDKKKRLKRRHLCGDIRYLPVTAGDILSGIPKSVCGSCCFGEGSNRSPPLLREGWTDRGRVYLRKFAGFN